MAKKKKNVNKKKINRMLILFPLNVFLLVVLVSTIGKYWVDIANKYKEKNDLNNRYILLKEKEAQLLVDVDKLQDPDYIARYAREKYLFSKDGEIILRLPDE